MKAIQTYYNGYKFRSRLEARWAVFFDALQIEYEYELEGYNLGDLGYYLPDFYLPDIKDGMWVEVKPLYGEGNAQNQIIELCKITDKCGTVLSGEPMQGYLHAKGDPEGWVMLGAESWDMGYIFCFCPWCNKIGFEFDGRGARVCGYKKHNFSDFDSASDSLRGMGLYGHADKGYTGDHMDILSACVKARQARFEHGEMPF